jgi:5-formyltetrahydrofolate cyclo-ligase
MSEVDEIRMRIRMRIWKTLQEKGLALPPYPVEGRIPNFKGAVEAARKLSKLPEWIRATVVKVNPDSPQRPVRMLALKEGKVLVMPTPRIKSGFLLLDPSRIPASHYQKASTIRGAFKYGVLLKSLSDVERRLGRVDFIVEGSVAVDRQCNRLGKGEGYGDIEYALLYLIGKVDEKTPVATTVSDLQIVDSIPVKPHDLPLDIIVTPSRVYRCPESWKRRPKGLVLESLRRHKVEEIPLLREALTKYYGEHM